MPNTPSSAQMNTLTSSNDGVNVQATLQPKSHFFIEDAALTQSQNQAFGAISVDKFRTTAKVSIPASKKVYTICHGQIFIQPQLGDVTNSKVNVILKPYIQPIKGLAIKYFIYRGLNKSDFIDDVNNIVVPEATTEFTQYIWDQFNNFYADDTDPIPTFSNYFIGWPQPSQNRPTTDYIDKYFNKITPIIDDTTGQEDPSLSFELPIVPKGIELGSVIGELGIDVVLDNGEYYIENDTSPFKLDLAFAQLEENIIDVTGETNSYIVKQKKDACTQFIDIASFYGLHANGTGEIFMNSGSISVTTKSDVYSKLSGFYTKNNLYLYIQSDRQRYYNFYDNYNYSDANSNNLKIGDDDANLTETTFGTLGWPIHVYNTAQDPATDVNTICLKLTTDGFEEAILYVEIGGVITEHNNNFIEGINLIEKKTDIDEVVDVKYTKKLKFQFPSQTSENIAGVIRLIYSGRAILVEEVITPEPIDPIFHLLKNIDDIFGLINSNSHKVALLDNLISVVIEEKLQIINLKYSVTNNYYGTFGVKKTEDRILIPDSTSYLPRVTYETCLKKSKQKKSTFSQVFNEITDNDVSGGNNDTYEPTSPYFLTYNSFEYNTTTIININLNLPNNKISSKLIIGISQAENDRLKSIISSHQLINNKIFFKDFQILDDVFLTSEDNILYKSYSIGIIGENVSGVLKIFKPPIEIIVYSTDKTFFFSQEYSQYKPMNNTDFDWEFNNITLQ